MDYKRILEFYKNKKVLITGNTGFKGSWLTHILLTAGADVTGYSLEPPTEPSLFRIAGLDKSKRLRQVYNDVRDYNALLQCATEVQPDIVMHMAAQPLVRESYSKPVDTFSTNVMGTVHICEVVRQTQSVKSFLNVTTDKVYNNKEKEKGYKENDELGGSDPYSSSKACSEFVTESYKVSFFDRAVDSSGDPLTRTSTVRAGNVIGGGDFSKDRIIPDCVRAVSESGVIKVRNPYSVRPYQHVLDPLFAYLMIAAKQYSNANYSGNYNVGPDEVDCVNTGRLAALFCDNWNIQESATLNKNTGKLVWKDVSEKDAPHETNCLKLDSSKLKKTFGWKPKWHIEDAVRETTNWTKVWKEQKSEDSICREMDREINLFIQE